MTHPNFQTNGASLEDCHTNFFALTELSGIKWRKLVWLGDNSANQQHHHHGSVHHQHHQNHQEPLDDPVLRSYARCLAADILCVWRRVATPRHSNDVFELGPPPPAHPPPLNLSAAKELWIFWYGEEPDLNELVAPELNASECEQGSWESGLSYKCRSLLFKALHNLIERCLLSRDFIRLGKWFVQPYDGVTRRQNGPEPGQNQQQEEETNASAHLSFSFAFFVHGESTVCASVDVRQHPPVRRLTRQHIHQAHASQGVKVILAPFGLSGVLTGLSFKSPDASNRLLEEWSQFYPLDKSTSLSESSIVEVIVGGVKMRYPSCYVLVTDIDDNSVPNSLPLQSALPNGTANNVVKGSKSSVEIPAPRTGSPILIQTPPPSPVPINSKVPQPGPFGVSTEHINSITRESTAATILPERVWQECIHGGPPGCNNASGTVHEFNGQWDLVDPTKKVGCTCSKCPPAPFNQQEAPLSYPQTQESIAVPSVGSPPSVTPSPLPNPNSQQPASVPPGEQQMPTLSPHLSCASPMNKSYTPEQSRTPTIASVKTEPVENPEMAPLSPPQSQGQPVASVECKSEGKNEAPSLVNVLKRPLLSGLDYENSLEDEETSLDLLYDYSTMEAWLNHPVKRFKGNIKDHQRITNAHKTDIYSLYTQNGMTGSNYHVNQSNLKIMQSMMKQEIKQEPISGDCDNVSTAAIGLAHGVKRPGDLYEFEEGDAVNTCNMEGLKRVPGVIKEELQEIKKTTSENYSTIEGLQPSYRDLDEIFDNSDDTSGDETIQIQTPPSSTMISSHEENKRFAGGGHGTCPTIGILRPEELSKMFPTPPSLEHNPIASPCGQLDLQPPDFTDLTIAARVKQEIYPNMGSPQEENIEDWSYVFKPPVSCKMVGSSKYAPLTNLPSQSQPPVQFPSHCLYRPSWMQHAEKSAQNLQNSNQNTTQPPTSQSLPASNTHSIPSRQATPQPLMHPRPNTPASLNPFSPGMAGFRPPPPPYEMPSPVGSTYAAKTTLEAPVPAAAPQNINRLAPEGSALLLNILLTDTAFNIFRDHNFDSCTLCVCNGGGGNIRGADAGVYLTQNDSHHLHNPYHPYHSQNGLQTPDSPYPGLNIGQPPPYGMISPTHHQNTIEEDAISCSCGFSAVVNRRLAHGSGMFYEDEREITGITEDPGEKKKPSLVQYLTSISSVKHEHAIDRDQVEAISAAILDLICDHCGVIPNTASALTRAADQVKSLSRQRHLFTSTINILEFTDSNEVTILALEQSKHVDLMGSSCKEEAQRRMVGAAVHRWPFLRASGPRCNQDIVRVMKSLRPLLQDAIQKKCQTRLWEAPSAVKGPLTWRQFHRLAGRGTDDRCEPQPIPSVVVGHERDWLSLSPYALQHWESLLLEPYSYSRDVAYIVVAPDNEAILTRVRWFFRELSTAYEMCKLGRHSPITKILRDGILRVGKTAKSKLANEPVEEWFTMLGESEQTDMLKLYAQVCKHHLAPHLTQIPMDKTLLDPPPEIVDKPAPSPMPPPTSTPDNNQSLTPDKQPSTPKSDQDGDCTKDFNSPSTHPSVEVSHEDDEREAPCVVLYLVEPFSLGSDQPELQRLACLGLLRCFQSVLAALPDNVRSNVNVQLISLESILELGRTRERSRHSNHMRALSLSIFAQCRRLLVHTNNVKSLTGFGTAAMTDLFLKNKDEKNRAPYKLYTPPYVLAPMREKVESTENFGKGNGDQGSILYVSYCLSEDQSWLLAVATDERGEILESTTINVDIPNRARRKKASARRVGLERLMNFIIGVLSQSARPWRLVIGRLGRIGHGELKGWSWLLSKKKLLRASQYLKEVCTQCSLMYPSNVPCILSACLVSLEPDTALRLMPDQFTPDERFGQASVNSQLQTPQDVSCTHILVFPTSATTQSQQTTFQEQQNTELGDEELFTIHEEMEDCIDEMQSSIGFNDIIFWGDSGVTGGQSPNGSPRHQESGPGSPNCGNNIGGQGSPFQIGSNSMKLSEQPEEVGQLLQQPLALGYLVSTAPTGRMPRWFWSACPHLEGVCPAFLKNALHLNSPNVQHNSDDLFPQSTASAHPLDTNSTTDVLRYVLEGYNALSWLALDSNTRDRLSCLPVHMQVLIQLYHTASALF